jgi:Protein of unknown function (DUF3800)
VHVYCDESGNTGAALLDAAQPFFALASTSVESETAVALIGSMLRKGQVEVKYSKLRGTPVGQKQLIGLFSSDELSRTTCKFWVTDKFYYLIGHLVDKLIEPPLYEAGIDLYAKDAHVSLANLWFHAGPRIFPGGGWKRVLTAFLDAARRLTDASFAAFDSVLTRAAAMTPPDLSDFATGLLLARGRLNEFLGCYRGRVVFDPACDDFVALMQAWMSDTPDFFDVTHDRSKPMARNEALMRAYMTPAPARYYGYGERKKELPLRISTLEFGDSVQHPSLQLADLIAGAAIDFAGAESGKRDRTGYHDALAETHFPQLCIGGLLPFNPLEQLSASAPQPAPGEVSLVDGNVAFLEEVGYIS